MSKILIIAEAGVNHNGSIDRAKEMIRAAAAAGADVVKFQTFNTEKLVNISAPQAEYQKKNMGTELSQYEMLKALELSFESHHILIQCAKEEGIAFNSTPFDNDSMRFLDTLGIDFWKVPSGEITNIPFLRNLGKYPHPVILSTGMSTLADVDIAISSLVQGGISREEITLLHCNTDYPSRVEDVNLKAMTTLRNAFDLNVGYSDHTLGIEIPIAAAALGATVIEKHFTLDKALPGPDHKASLEPDELKLMVRTVRNIEIALGDGRKQPTLSESKNMGIARKSLVAACDIAEGEILGENNLCIKRPGTGISPLLWDSVIGSRAHKSYQKDELI